MKKRLLFLAIIIISTIIMCSCNQIPEVYIEPDYNVQKQINKVNSFPDLPKNYSYFNYKEKALSLDSTVFNFAFEKQAKTPAYNPYDQSTWNPLGFWIDQERQPDGYDPLTTGYMKRTFGLPAYVGDNRVQSSGREDLTYLSMLLGSTYAGIDKSRQVFGDETYNFIEMALSSYDTGCKLVHNAGTQGQSFWYDIFPQIIFARLYDKYQDIPYMKQMVLNGADQWLKAIPNLVKEGKANYEFVGYNVVLDSPTAVGDHIEPPNGGLAFLFYSAYEITKEEKYLNGAKKVLDYLQDYQKNPNYEALTDYAPFVAAVLNRKYGTDYDVGKFLDFVFESDSAFRPGWAVMQGEFGNYAVDGLVGQDGDYAFSMNSFHLASVLAPLVKYDTRYATAIGKYLLNLVNNAKVFFPHNLPLSHQTMNNYLIFDKKGAICYEGFRNNHNGINGLAMGDATAMFSQPSDLSLYSAAFAGALGGMVALTDIKGILQIDLNNTDSFGANDYQNYLYYNPYDKDKTIKFNGGNNNYDLFDAVTKRVIARNVSDSCNISIPAQSSRVIIVLPANSVYNKENNKIVVNNIDIAEYQVAVNICDLASRAELTSDSIIKLEFAESKNDKVTNMKILFNEIEVYNGGPLEQYSYDKAMLPDTDYTMKIVIKTENGLVDYCSKRVIAR